MAFYVSTLYNLPVGSIKYFIFVIDKSDGVHSAWVNQNLQQLGETLGSAVGVVTGPDRLTKEVYRFLADNLKSNYGAVEGLLHETTSLLISEGSLSETQTSLYLIPVATNSEQGDATVAAALIQRIGAALRENRLQEFIRCLGARELQLEAIGGGFIVCTLRQINDVFVLQPNLAGIGVNINAVIEKFLPPETRSLAP